VDRAKADADRARLLDDLLDVLADPAIPDDQAGRITYACNLGYAGMADASGSVVLAAAARRANGSTLAALSPLGGNGNI
jgi:hypothetical protein